MALLLWPLCFAPLRFRFARLPFCSVGIGGLGVNVMYPENDADWVQNAVDNNGRSMLSFHNILTVSGVETICRLSHFEHTVCFVLRVGSTGMSAFTPSFVSNQSRPAPSSDPAQSEKDNRVFTLFSSCSARSSPAIAAVA